MAEGGRRPTVLLVLASAALAASWNAISAPFGLVVGAITAALCAATWFRARVLGARVGVALGLATAAMVSSAMVLGLLVGLGRNGGEAVLDAPPAGERSRLLDDAARETRDEREAARGELESLRPAR